MRNSARFAVTIAAAALLTGCALPLDSAAGRLAADAKGSGSWMLPEAKSRDLLYVVIPTVNVRGSVNVYAYPQGTLEGQITDLTYPYGECADAEGNVYVTDLGVRQNTIVEYAHGGTQPLRTLQLPSYNAASCAVDPVNGDLAVTEPGRLGKGANVAVFHKAGGRPRTYTDPDLSDYVYCAYDNSDDLFVDGHYPGGYQLPKVAELPRGGSSMLTIDLDVQPGWLSSVQWDGKYLAVGQAVTPSIMRYRISGSTGTLVGSTMLSDATNAYQFVFAGKRVIVANYYFFGYLFEYDVLVYHYPQGGNSAQQLFKGANLIVGSIALSRHR